MRTKSNASFSKLVSLVLSLVGLVTALTACGKNDKPDDTSKIKHELITMTSVFPNENEFLLKVKEKYPEINVKFVAQNETSDASTFNYPAMTNDLPDIYVATSYVAGRQKLSENLLNLSGYDFVSAYNADVMSALKENGEVYLLPTYFTCGGITYNKTVFEKNGWNLPASLSDMTELKTKAEAAGYNFCLTQIDSPDDGFRYVFDILSAGYFNGADGKKWQEDFIAGNDFLSGSKAEQAFSVLEKWKECGLLNGNGKEMSDADVKKEMAKGKTLFMLGGTNEFIKEDSESEFGLMPYLSEDGKRNVCVVNISSYVGLNKKLAIDENKQKLEDALHVLEIMSTVDGMSSLNENDNVVLPLDEYQIPENGMYKGVEKNIKDGKTAMYIYSGWEKIVSVVGQAAVGYICGDKTLYELKKCIDDNRDVLSGKTSTVDTSVTNDDPQDFLLNFPAVFVGEGKYIIEFATIENGLGWVEINGEKFHTANAGALVTGKNFFKVEVPVSKLNSAKKYSVSFRKIERRTSYSSKLGEEERQEFIFKPVEKKNNIKIYQVGDVHGRTEFAKKCCEYFGNETDLFILNGDMGEMEEIWDYYSIIELAGEISNARIPVIYNRGNHETRGAVAELAPEYLPSVNGKFYYSFDLGAIRGVVLDCGEDKLDSDAEYGGVNDFATYRREETEFLRELAANNVPDGNDAPYIVVSHTCPLLPDVYRDPRFMIEGETYAEWARLLGKLEADIMICAHVHEIFYYPVHSPKLECDNTFPVVIATEVSNSNLWGLALEVKNGTFEGVFTDINGSKKLAFKYTYSA